jgi:ABC-type multidrug transport system fused ATPase/permease subunit
MQANGTFLERAAEFARDFARYSGKRGVLAAVCVALGAVLEGVGVVLLIPILAVVVDTGPRSGRMMAAASRLFALVGAGTRFEKLAALVGIFAVLMLLRAVVLSVRDVTIARLQIGFVSELRLSITRKLATAPWEVVSRLHHARVTQVMSANVGSISGATAFLLQCAVSVTMLVSQCVLAFILSPLLASFAIIVLAAGGLALNSILKRARAMGRFAMDANLMLTSSTAQFLGGLKLAVSQDLQESFVSEYHSTLNTLTARQIAYTRQRTNARLAVITLLALVSGLAVLVGFGVLDVAPSLLIAVLYLLARMNGPAMQIQQGAQLFASSLPAYETVKELLADLDSAAAPEVSGGTPQIEIPDGPIVFRAVSYSHAADGDAAMQTPVLDAVDLRIEAGSFIGISGASGAGKTTFADLLVGLVAPQAGEITVGGLALRGPVLNTWRRRVSYVSQDPFLFHDTIRRNLLWAAPGASEDDLWSALTLAGADALVRRMELGLETIVGERGTLVSGGERQRLALARAVLRRPHLLVLDEATNAIDVASEHEMLARLIALRPRPTIVMIAHRQESVALCERVAVLEDGRFAEASGG